MNDHDAMEEINAALERFYSSQVGPFDAIKQIAQISGLNRISHAAVKEARK